MKNLKVNKEIIILIIILAFAFFIRIYALGGPPLWVDESISAAASQAILEKGVPVLDSGSLYARAYFFHYLQAFLMLFGQNDFTIRFISVIFGLATIVLGYYVGKEYSPKYGGVITALFLSVFFLEVFYSRQARFYQLFQLAFFLSLFLLYKSKQNPKLIYPALAVMFIAIDTQIAGLVLTPFFIVYILLYNEKQKWLAAVPMIPLIYKFMQTLGLASSSTETASNYIQTYFSYTTNFIYLLLLFIPGAVWAFLKNKRLTIVLLAPSVILLIGVFSLETFALRYSYFFAFPLIVYSSLLFAFLIEKYGNSVFIPVVLLLLIPSNIFFPLTYTNVILPISANHNDLSAPEIDLKNIPPHLVESLKNPDSIIITHFSPSVEWYLKKPDYVLPFSLDGRGEDQVSYEGSDIYSGAPIITEVPQRPYYVVLSYFALSKLTPSQKELLDSILKDCTRQFQNKDAEIFECR